MESGNSHTCINEFTWYTLYTDPTQELIIKHILGHTLIAEHSTKHNIIKPKAANKPTHSRDQTN